MDERMPWRDQLVAMDPRRRWRKWGLSKEIFFRGRYFVWAYLRNVPGRRAWRNHGTLGAAADAIPARRVEMQVSPGGHSDGPEISVHVFVQHGMFLIERPIQSLYQEERDRFGVDSEELEPLEAPPWEKP